MNKSCGNCNNSIWRDGTSPFPQDCIRCVYVEVKGEKQPSNWRAKPMTNADRFRAMSDEEQQKCVRRFWEIEDFADWLQQPPRGNENE